MKKITLLLFALFTCWQLGAQVSSYAFSQGNSTYTEITGGTVLGTATNDDTNFNALPIGFTFAYNGVNYTQFSVNANGFIAMGASVTSSYVSISGGTTNNVIAAFNADLQGIATTGELSYILSGTAPNRVLTIQWKNYRHYTSSTAANVDNYNFQIILNETTNVIDVVYGSVTQNATNRNHQVGLRGASNANFNNRTTTTDWNATTAGATNSVDCLLTSTILPASGLKFTWTPPSCLSPNGFASSLITTTTATISWNAQVPAPSVGYEYYYSITNSTPTGSGTATTSASASLTSLSPSTLYYVWLRTDCGGNQSSLSGPFTFTTACNPFAIPFTESFNSTSTTKSCWRVLNVNADTDAWVLSDTAFPYEGDQSASIYTDYNGGANNDWLISPPLTLTGDQRVKFQYRVRSATEPNDFELLLSTTDTNPASFTTVLVPNTSYDNITYQELKVDLSSYTGNVYIAWHVPNGGLDGWYLYIDNVIVEDNPPCVEPNMFVSSNITSNSVDLSWNDPSGNQFDYEYLIQPQGTGMPTGSGIAVGDFMVTDSSLSSATNYEAWVRAYCSITEQSIWVGPINFTTLCVSVTDFIQNFETTTGNTFPTCWSKVGASGTAYPQASTGISGSRNLYMYSSSSTSRAVVSMVPVSNADAGTHRMNMKVRGNFSAGETIELGYLTNPNDATTFIPISSIVTNSASVSQDFITVPSGLPSGDVVFALRTGTVQYSVLVDDIKWEILPSTPPSCATNVVATPNATCGNFSNSISWDPTPSADGYYVKVGTSAGASDIANNIDVAGATTYNFVGATSTIYYYTITPYNVIGSATGCAEASFVTAATGCYCNSVPTSNDNSGITNVQLATTNFPTGDVTYFDHTATTVDLAQGINSNVQITFGTGYTYNTYIFIDFNNDFDFTDAGELVFTGESLSANPTTYNASFVMPGSAPLGNHRMRIVTADDLLTANPCYSGSYGITLDFNINIVAPSCTPPSFDSATVVHDCVNSVFNVNINITDLGNGTPSITDGTNTWPVTSIGIIQVGPFAYGSSVSLTLLHGTDSICDLSIGTLNYAVCPPSNDDCVNAEVLTPGGSFATNSVTGSNVGATNSTETLPGCAFYSGGDVWYQVAIPASGNLTVETNSINGSSITDTGMAVYSGSCGSLVLIECDDDDSADGNFSLVALTGRTAGEIVYVRVWEYGNDIFDGFQVSAYDASLSSTSFDLTNFKAYPNPVKDILNLEYSLNITSIRIVNLLGQEVISKTINATATNVDMSQLNSGAYIVNVIIDGSIQSIKVIKE